MHSFGPPSPFCIDKFHINVPWKNLYTDPVTAEIDGLYIVAGPASGMYAMPISMISEVSI